jgi:hypothetical protein
MEDQHDRADSPEESAEPDQAQRSSQQALWVDIQVRQAMRRGEFDNLPGSGKPIQGLGETHDPDWWAKQLIEREQITGLGPPAILLRREDGELDDRLDRETTESAVRGIVEDFNARIIEARRQLLGGPPVITKTRDVDEQVEAWRMRRDERRAHQRRELAVARTDEQKARRRPRWWPFGR